MYTTCTFRKREFQIETSTHLYTYMRVCFGNGSVEINYYICMYMYTSTCREGSHILRCTQGPYVEGIYMCKEGGLRLLPGTPTLKIFQERKECLVTTGVCVCVYIASYKHPTIYHICYLRVVIILFFGIFPLPFSPHAVHAVQQTSVVLTHVVVVLLW